MASYKAVAAVTAVLHDLISDEVARLKDVGSPAIKVDPPKDTRNDAQGDQPAIHIYLYRVTENAVWRNDDLPLRSENGRLLQRPRLALNLHYLISFYGKESDYVPQRLLGAVAGLFQRKPILTTSVFAAIQAGGDDSLKTLLTDSRLSDEVEQVKLSMTTLDVEELSKLWSVLLQVPYTLSLTYEAAVVFIEPDEQPEPRLPVFDRRIAVAPGASPAVATVPRISDLTVADATVTLTIEPPLEPVQSALLLLIPDFRETDPPARQLALTWEPASEDGPTSVPAWSVADVEPGSYVARVLVEGHVSALDFAPDGSLLGPFVRISEAT